MAGRLFSTLRLVMCWLARITQHIIRQASPRHFLYMTFRDILAHKHTYTLALTLTGSANNALRPPHASPRVHLVICSSCSMQISCCCLWWSCCCALRLRPVKALTRDPNETISLLCCSRAHRDRNAERAGEREKEHARARRGVKRATHVSAH